MLSVANMPIMLSVIMMDVMMLNVAMLSVIILNVIMLNIARLSVVVAPLLYQSTEIAPKNLVSEIIPSLTFADQPFLPDD